MADKFTTISEQDRELRIEPISPQFPITVVCLSDLFWDEHWSSEQQIMSRLAKRCRVLYVDRPVSILSSLTGVSDGSIWLQWKRWLQGGLRQESENLTILTPSPVLPQRYNRFVNKINAWLLQRSVRSAMRKAGFESPVLWIYSPDVARVVGTLGESHSIYYCADDWAASRQWWNNSANISLRENELAAKVDLIVGTSTKIVQRWKQSGFNPLLMTNGADLDLFQSGRDASVPIPEDLKDIPTPRIGYVGCIDTRFDSTLYLNVAEKHPDWHFVIVGPVTGSIPNLARLKALANVHFLGSRAKSNLPGYLKYFDVCTIPYVIDKLSESIFPLKLFEYLSAGRPVVSTALPELLPYGQYVHVTDTLERFEDAIESSLNNPLPIASDDFLAQNSWDAKAEAMWETLQGLVPRQRIQPKTKFV